MQEVAERRREARALWAAGDYDVIAELIWDVGERLVRRLSVRPGERVLDVACGTGNAAIPAAQAGGIVTGVDLTPELFGPALRRAAAAGVEVDWVEGDAESLPFADGSFDVVTSTFGCMFAPGQEQTAAEIARVMRPGARAGIASWTPEGTVGDFFRVIGGHLPPPPEPFSPPTLWGSEPDVRALLEPHGLALECEREEVVFRFESADGLVSLYEHKFGPVLMARRLLEPEGRWAALRQDLVELFERHNTAADGGMEYGGEYLVVSGRRS